MRVAVLSALEAEITLLTEAMERTRRSDVAGWPIWRGALTGIDTVLASPGMGKVHTAALTALIWEKERPDLFLFTGVAGGLDPELGIGDVVVGERTIQHDAGVVTPEGLEVYQPGHVPFLNPTEHLGYAPSQRLLTNMRSVAETILLSPVLDRDPRVVFGTILTGDFFLQDPSTRDRLRSALDGKAIEMEGAALAQVASRLGVDHLVIRALSDLAGEEAVVHFARFADEVSANSARLVLGLLDGLEKHQRDDPTGT